MTCSKAFEKKSKKKKKDDVWRERLVGSVFLPRRELKEIAFDLESKEQEALEKWGFTLQVDGV